MTRTPRKVFLERDVADRLDQTADRFNESVSEIVNRAVITELDTVAPVADPRDRVEYLLRDTRCDCGCISMTSHGPDWKSGGGRWLLNWFLQDEPDWQEFHTAMMPRHWPLTVGERERRCLNNGGVGLSVNQEIDTIRDVCDPEFFFPSDFGALTTAEWDEIVQRFRGCCGERLRGPSEGHWDEICDLPPAAQDGLLSPEDVQAIFLADDPPSEVIRRSELLRSGNPGRQR